jgi:hypothetical protein
VKGVDLGKYLGGETKMLQKSPKTVFRKFFEQQLWPTKVCLHCDFSWWEMAANEECELSILFGQCSLCRCVQTHRHHHLDHYSILMLQQLILCSPQSLHAN